MPRKKEVKFLIRLDEPLHRSLKTEAERALRSLNSEMLLRLRQSFVEQPEAKRPVPPAAA